jgi:hypothetical protein
LTRFETASSRGIRLQLPGATPRGGLQLLFPRDRRIRTRADLRGAWNKGEYSKARGLYGRTLGIVGLGQIGREIASRAQAFGMRVLAWSRSLTHEEADWADCVTPLTWRGPELPVTIRERRNQHRTPSSPCGPSLSPARSVTRPPAGGGADPRGLIF